MSYVESSSLRDKELLKKKKPSLEDFFMIKLKEFA